MAGGLELSGSGGQTIKFGVSVSSTVFFHLFFSGMDMINSNLKDQSWVFGIHFSLGRGVTFFPFIILYCTIAEMMGVQ